jgi:intein/homing endonuclease
MDIYTFTTNSGRELTATNDHKFKTNKGRVKVIDIQSWPWLTGLTLSHGQL